MIVIAAVLSAMLLPVSTMTTKATICLPAGIWETEELLVRGPNALILKGNDTGYTGLCEMCPGFSLESHINRPSPSTASENGLATSDVASYKVQWTWTGTTNPIPTTVQNVSHSDVAILDGTSPADNGSGATPGATAVTADTAAMTYAPSPVLVSNKTTTQTITANGFYNQSRGHTVAFVTQAGQHFRAYSTFAWYEN